MHILNSLPEYNLFGVENQDYESARVVAIPVPYDSTVTYKSGSRNGPRAIIEASRNIELYSYELNRDISKVGIFTTEELAPDFGSPERMINGIEKEVSKVLEDGKLPFMIGGEHSIAIGAIAAVRKIYDNGLSVIQFDAHSDSRDELYGSKYMHACVMARAHELSDSVFNVGVRSIEIESAKNLEKGSLVTMHDLRIAGIRESIKKVIEQCEDNVYITIDLDVLDPSEMPSVGTPEPDGLRFAELCNMIEEVAKHKHIVGIDMTELCPIPGMHSPDFMAAKLAYLAIGYATSGSSK